MVERVFISAVTSEFGAARDAIATDLRARGMFVRVQSDFRQEAAHTLLGKLHDYVRGGARVVCVIGASPGWFPTEAEAAPFAAMLPAGVTEASYTQWEFFFARHYDRRLSVHVATAAVRPADGRTSAADSMAPAQRGFVDHVVREQGIDWSGFATPEELRIAVLREDWNPGDKPIVLPYPSLGTLFKGRAGFLARLRISLTRADGGTAAIAGRAVHGLGGVGKTRAAVEYAWAHQADYTALLLLDAETEDKLHAGLAALVGPLRLTAAEATTDAMARMEAAVAWLNANPGWFLILDNIDAEPALVAAHRLLGRLSGGHVVLTSRLARFPRGVERLDLDVLTPDDAATFLLEATETGRRRADDDAVQARALAEELGRLTLALEMAAATVEARRMSFAQYREAWQGNRARVVGWARSEITGYHHAVAETWRTSVDQLTEPARHLLERLAFLAPDPVPIFLLDVPVPGAEAEDAVAALDDLATYSLVARDVEGLSFLVHRLVQDVTRRGLEQGGTAQVRLTEALGWVDAAFTGDPQDVRTWSRLVPLAPHADAVAGHADKAGIADPTGRLMAELGSLFQVQAAHVRAEPLMRRALAIAEASVGKDPPEFATRLNNLATLLHATSRPGEAEPLMRRALAIDEATLGKDHPNVARDLNNLAMLLQATNRLDEAEPLMRRALTIDEVNFGNDHPRMAIRLNNYAQLLQDTDRLDEAEPLMRRVVAIFELNHGPNVPSVATALSNLAALLHDTDRPCEAEPLMRRALVIDEAILGKNHPNVAIHLNNLAQLLQDTNRLGEAEPPMRRQLAIFLAFQRDTGHAHPHRDVAIENYTRLLAAMGRSEADTAAALAALQHEVGLDQA